MLCNRSSPSELIARSPTFEYTPTLSLREHMAVGSCSAVAAVRIPCYRGVTGALGHSLSCVLYPRSRTTPRCSKPHGARDHGLHRRSSAASRHAEAMQFRIELVPDFVNDFSSEEAGSHGAESGRSSCSTGRSRSSYPQLRALESKAPLAAVARLDRQAPSTP